MNKLFTMSLLTIFVFFSANSSQTLDFGKFKLLDKKIVYNGKKFDNIMVYGAIITKKLKAGDINSFNYVSKNNIGEILVIEAEKIMYEIPMTKILSILSISDNTIIVLIAGATSDYNRDF